MTSFINKSTHPVAVKKVFVEIWTLRDEIETAIAQRIAEDGHSEDSPVDIEDIKAYYHKHLNIDSDEDDDDSDESEEDQNLDPSGNPMDDDAAAMMAAMGGGEDGDEDKEENDEDKEDSDADAKDDSEEEEPKEEDDEASEEDEKDEEAAKLAEEMLADQGGSDEDDEAAKLAAEMLADQGGSEEDDEAAKLAAEMLADQGGSEQESKDDKHKVREPFERVRPDESKIGKGYVLLSDIVMDQMLLFCNKNFTIGQNLVVEFQVTKPFSVTAELNVSQDIGRNSKIIKKINFGRRLQTIFLFQFPGERSNLRNFLKAIEPDIPSPPKKLKRPETDSDDDDFDDLGF